MSEKLSILKPGEKVIAVWAETASGPGWANAPLWVLVGCNAAGTYRITALQPDQYAASSAIRALYKISHDVHYQLCREVENLVTPPEEP